MEAIQSGDVDDWEQVDIANQDEERRNPPRQVNQWTQGELDRQERNRLYYGAAGSSGWGEYHDPRLNANYVQSLLQTLHGRINALQSKMRIAKRY